MLGKGKKEKKQKEGYIGAGKFWAWESRELSDAGFSFLMGYIMFYCTDVIKVNPLTVGTLFAVSKIIDAITDVLAGYIVDRTNTKWGKGRPYDICLIGAWISGIMLFSCPTGWGETAKLIWIMVWYILANAVFYTFLNAGEGVFWLRTFDKPQVVKMSSVGNIATSLMGLVCGIFLPQMIANAGNDPAAWSKLVITAAIPLCAIGLCRFLFVRERDDLVYSVEEKAKVELKEIFQMLSKNHYWTIYCVIVLLSYTVTNMGVTVYYFDKILGNLGIQSVFAGVSVLAVFSLVFLPKLMKKFPFQKILLVGQLLSLGLNLICFIFYDNIVILVVCYVLNIFVTLPGTYALRILMYDNAIFNEYLGLHRLEGTLSSVVGFMKRAGGAIGSFILGVALTLIQYDADATTLKPITFWGLRIMMYGIPAVCALIQAGLWSLYKLEKRMPEIKAELEERNKSEE